MPLVSRFRSSHFFANDVQLKTILLYLGAQYSYACFCGESYDTYGAAPESECDTTCSVGLGICGGGYRNSVYDTSPMVVDQGRRAQYQTAGQDDPHLSM